jgi:AraC-like DNA-binding protein
VAPDLRERVACVWAAQLGATGERHVERVIPDGCIDLVFSDGKLVISGPDTASVELEVMPNRSFVGVRFRAGVAPTALGVPATALLDRRVPARDVLGARAAELEEALAEAAGARQAAALLERAAGTWLREAPDGAADALVRRAVLELEAARRDWTVTTLAAKLGLSERQLRRRFVGAVGYGPKLMERVLRLRRFIRAASRLRSPGLATLALEAGYADQPHLSRECRELTGITPTQLLGYPVTAA